MLWDIFLFYFKTLLAILRPCILVLFHSSSRCHHSRVQISGKRDAGSLS